MSTFEQKQDRWEELHSQAAEHYYREEFEEAEAKLHECRQIAEELKDPRLVGQTLNTLAGILDAKNDLDAALKAALESFEIVKDLSDLDGYDLATTARNVARLYHRRDEHEQAIQWYEKSLKLHEEADDGQNLEEAVTLLQMANVAFEMERDADGYMMRSMEIALQDTQGDALADVAMGLARLLAAMGRFADAETLLQRTLERQKEIYGRDLEELTSNPAWVMDYEVARLVIFCQAFQENDIEPNVMGHVRWLLAQVLSELGRNDEALEQFVLIDDSLRKEAESSEELFGDDDEDITELVEDFAEQLMEMADVEEDDEEDEDEFYDEDDEPIPIAGAEDEEDNPLAGISPRALLTQMLDAEGHFWMDRARFYADYAMTLHVLGEQKENNEMLHEARDKYHLAQEFLDEAEEPEETRGDIEDNLADLEEDLREF